MKNKLLESRLFQFLTCFVVGIIVLTVTIFIPDQLEIRQLKKDSIEIDKLVQQDKLETEQLTQSDKRKSETYQTHSEQGHKNLLNNVSLSKSKRNGSMTETPKSTNTSNGTVASEKRYASGIYKGMTYNEAMQQWKVRKSEVTKRLLASTDRSLELADVQLKSSRDGRSTLLSLFKHADPEQMELARQEALEMYPEKTEVLNTFFNDLANHSDGKSLDEIAQDADYILTERQAWRIAFNQNNAEFDQVKQDLFAVNKDKPIHP
ncbi:MAG: hypothetical protein OXM61_17020 [Candidatus Poribacteria bacterium]|nr:hypothetical protein [Candidatus Poribacteria bacterium]